MKKKTTLRTGAIITVLAMMTMCLSGSSFAKYQTLLSGTGSAYVAYWGFADTPTELKMEKLFKPKDKGYEAAAGLTERNLIAPGASGSMPFQFCFVPKDYSYSGEFCTGPEVDYEFSVYATGEIPDELAENPNLKFRLDGGEYGTFQQLLLDIRTLSGDNSGRKIYKAGTLPQSVTTTHDENEITHSISWKWDYEQDPNIEVIDPIMTQDELDTMLASNELNKCSITIQLCATQLNPGEL